MKKLFILIFLIIMSAAATTSSYAGLHDTNACSVRCRNGRISITASRISFMSLIKQICRKTSLDIYMVDQKFPDIVNLTIEDSSIEQALRFILRGYNHAVVYSPEGKGGGGVFIGQHLMALENDHIMIASARATRGEGQTLNTKSHALSAESEVSGTPIESTVEESRIHVADQKSVTQNNHPIASTSNRADGRYPVNTAGNGASVIKNSVTAGEMITAGSIAANTIQTGTAGTAPSASESAPSSADMDSGSYPESIDPVNNSASASDEDFMELIVADNESDNPTADDEISDEISDDTLSTDPEGPISKRERFLTSQIYILEGQIESGYAQQWYDQWSQIKDPKYLETHEEKLAYYQAELEKLRSR